MKKQQETMAGQSIIDVHSVITE